MSPPRTAETDSSLANLELAGALSARLAHALSNHLSIITGNLCVAGAFKNDPEKLHAALHAALTAANSAGSILGRFNDLRRAIKSEVGSTTIHDLQGSMENWVKARPDWRLHFDLPPSQALALTIEWSWLCFVLDAIAGQARPGPRSIMVKGADASAVRTNPLLLEVQPVAHAQIQINYSAASAIDWNSIRTDLTPFHLAAAYELLSLSGAIPESNQIEGDTVLTQFTIPVIRFPAR